MSEQPDAPAAVPAKVNEWEWETQGGLVKLSVETVQKYFCPKATASEVMHFMAVAKYHRLNPWLREVYIIKYTDGEPVQIVMGKWAHARKAEQHPQYAGTESGIIVQLPNGSIERREGTFFLEPEKLVGGWAKVFRKDRDRPELREVKLSDWLRAGPYWKSSPAHMINKIAVSQARHEAFPGEYIDLVSEEEIQPGSTLDIVDIPMPQSVAEVASTQTQSPALELSVTEEEQAALEAEARAREQAEAAAEPTPSPAPKVDRSAVQTALLRIAKKNNESLFVLLEKLSGKKVSGVAALSDEEVAAIAKSIGVR